MAFTKQFSVEIVRHSSNDLLLRSSSQPEKTVKISLQNNLERDLVAILLRELHKKFCEAPMQIRQFGERDFFMKKEELWKRELDNLNGKIMESKQRFEDLKSNKEALDESRTTVDDLKEAVKAVNERDSGLGATELAQLREDVQFYKQEKAIFESKNAKMLKKIETLGRN